MSKKLIKSKEEWVKSLSEEFYPGPEYWKDGEWEDIKEPASYPCMVIYAEDGWGGPKTYLVYPTDFTVD